MHLLEMIHGALTYPLPSSLLEKCDGNWKVLVDRLHGKNDMLICRWQ